MNDRVIEIPLADIIDGEYRQDMGDLNKLIQSIKRHGLTYPIVVTRHRQVLAGQRRIEAVKQLGWKTVPAIVATNLNDAADLLIAERPDNLKKPMSVEEKVDLGMRLESFRAEDRFGGAIRGTITLRVVGQVTGLKGSSYYRARNVVLAARSNEYGEDAQAFAKTVLAEMNATRRITPAYEKIRKGIDLHLGGPRHALVTDAAGQRKALDGAVEVLAGITFGLRSIGPINKDITREEATRWMRDLSEARTALERVIKQLRGV
jgi:hypothetical protein